MRYIRGISLISVILTAMTLYQIYHTINHNGLPDITTPYGGDFLNYWAAPQLTHIISILFDQAAYTTQLATMYGGPIYDHNWSYPLHALFLLFPFSILPYFSALVLWTIAGIGLYISCVYALAQPKEPRILWLLLLAPSTAMCVVTGQNGFFIAAGMLGVLLLIDSRPITAGIILGLLSVKPQLTLLWPFLLLATGLWRTIFSAAATVVILVSASVWVHGIEAWRHYLTITPALQWALISDVPRTAEGAIYNYHAMSPSLIVGLRILEVPLTIAVVCQCLLSIVTIVIAALCFRRTQHLTQRAILLGSGCLLVTPYSYNYDMVLLSAALMLNWLERPPEKILMRWLYGLAYLMPVIIYKLNSHYLPIAPLILLLVFLDTARTVWKTPPLRTHDDLASGSDHYSRPTA